MAQYYCLCLLIRELQREYNTTHTKSVFRAVRIIRPHHPLFGEVVPLVKIWNHSKKRYYVIELPDRSHTRIPLDWADEGQTLLPEAPSNLPCLTVEAIKGLISLATTLEHRVSKTATKGLSSPHRRPKEDQHGKADGLFSKRGK